MSSPAPIVLVGMLYEPPLHEPVGINLAVAGSFEEMIKYREASANATLPLGVAQILIWGDYEDYVPQPLAEIRELPPPRCPSHGHARDTCRRSAKAPNRRPEELSRPTVDSVS